MEEVTQEYACIDPISNFGKIKIFWIKVAVFSRTIKFSGQDSEVMTTHLSTQTGFFFMVVTSKKTD